LRNHRFSSLIFVSALALSMLPTLAAHAGVPKAAATPRSKATALKLRDEPRKVAEAYLDALTGKGEASARGFLLGGVTFTAEDAQLANWKIVDRKAPLRESTFLAPAIKQMHDLDDAGAQALTQLLAADPSKTPPLAKLLGPTRTEMAAFLKDHPVFARVARVGKAVYWHPHNPWRLLVESIDQSGKYQLDFHVFLVREKTKSGARTWPLRVVRLHTDGHDTGWKILPASSWNPDF